jgi:hypothetical protein
MRPLAIVSGVLAALLPACTETYERCADGAVAVSANPLRCTRDAAADAPADACVAADEPGDGADSNCDGVDGVKNAQIYVSGERGDDATGNGLAPDRPLRTLTAALRLAADSASRRAVLLGAGDYPYAREADAGAVVSYQLRVPLRLHGGYAQDFLRRSGESVVRSSYVAAVIEGGATDSFVLSDLTLRGEAPVTARPGESVFGLAVLRAGSVRLERVNIFAARGASGGNGGAGTPGNNGGDATNIAGAAGCRSANGGNGGNGEGNGVSASAGGVGARGNEMGDAAGGDGGVLGAASLAGVEGERGADGDRGADGVPAPSGMMDARGYIPPAPVAGRDGRAGGGGGGGGGGRANTAAGIAGRGGGGGGGGCGGGGGEGGGGGGASIAIFVAEGTDLFVRGGRLEPVGGGNGGDGGGGGTGGAGGNGAAGEAPATPALGGEGGRGGRGGRGGEGGRGARGPGGPTFGVLRGNAAGMTVIDDTVMVQLGPGGNPGGNGGGTLNPALSQRIFVAR